MNNTEILEELYLGSSIAETDDNLVSYFVPTSALRDFINDRYDVIRGVKGSGKSAILRMVSINQKKYSQLSDIGLVIATEHTGEPAFKRAFDTLAHGDYDEAGLVNAWKTYLLNLILDAVEELPKSTESQAALAEAKKVGLRFVSQSTFKKVLWSLLRMIHVKKFSISADSISVEFPDDPPNYWMDEPRLVDFTELLKLCIKSFQVANKRCWILLDRLDAAFQEDYDLERVALKSLLLAYKDFMVGPSIRVKMFFRTDLFDLVSTGQGFRELTHVNDRTSPPISWDPDKLLQMIMERFIFNHPVKDKYGISIEDLADREDRLAAFLTIFPQQVDPGEKRPDTWNWILNRIVDGNGVRTPRDLQVLVQNSARKQLEFLHLGADNDAGILIDGVSVKAGLAQLSTDKIRTSLIAENPSLEASIRAFLKGKAEQNDKTLPALLGIGWEIEVEKLERIGLLEKVGGSWKIPMLYRDGLEVTQGAAFDK